MVLLPVLLFIRYNPSVRVGAYCRNYVICGGNYLFEDQIAEAFEVNFLEKCLFILINPKFDYSTSYSGRGMIVKTHYESYLIDRTMGAFAMNRNIRTVREGLWYITAFQLIALFGTAAPFLSIWAGIDTIIYSTLMVVFIFLVLFRTIPPFYLGKPLSFEELPLCGDECQRFKKIHIIKGFALSDRLAVIPFKKASHLDGLAVDLLFKRYIVLNPRLFSLGSRDYLRFVLFHELAHIKHHDGADVLLAAGLLSTLDFLIPHLPGGVSSFLTTHIPFYDYIIMGLMTLYLVFALVRRRSIEKRADRSGVECIGKDGEERVQEKLGINLLKGIS
jgi:hypothetical protein